MQTVDSKILQNQLEALDKAITHGPVKESNTVARKTPYAPYDVVFTTGRGTEG
ncbi:hypothetical protein [Sphingomonas sp.]|jgi:hypothetical protein|uniref:hypothetical protein n=1 Tax=Sphingomonas sp. TaxID=28214 RepID=UPI003D6D760B